MSLDKDVGYLVEDIRNGKIKKEYLQMNNWNDVDPEKLAFYFASNKKHFHSIKRIVQFVSGSIILLQNFALGSNREVYHSLTFAKQLLDETNQEIRDIHIPIELKLHHQHLLDSLLYLNRIFDHFILAESIFNLNHVQEKQVLFLLKSANEQLKKATSFELGLEMVELDSSCACGH